MQNLFHRWIEFLFSLEKHIVVLCGEKSKLRCLDNYISHANLLQSEHISYCIPFASQGIFFKIFGSKNIESSHGSQVRRQMKIKKFFPFNFIVSLNVKPSNLQILVRSDSRARLVQYEMHQQQVQNDSEPWKRLCLSTEKSAQSCSCFLHFTHSIDRLCDNWVREMKRQWSVLHTLFLKQRRLTEINFLKTISNFDIVHEQSKFHKSENVK